MTCPKITASAHIEPLLEALFSLPASSKSPFANRFASMARTSSSIHIPASAERVMSIIGDLENYPKWTSGITEVQVLERDSENRPIRVKFSLNGGPISDRVELKYVWQNNFVEWNLVSGNSIKALDGSYRVVESSNGCEVTYELSAEVDLPIPSFIKSSGEKTIITTALQGLKDFAS